MYPPTHPPIPCTDAIAGTLRAGGASARRDAAEEAGGRRRRRRCISTADRASWLCACSPPVSAVRECHERRPQASAHQYARRNVTIFRIYRTSPHQSPHRWVEAEPFPTCQRFEMRATQTCCSDFSHMRWLLVNNNLRLGWIRDRKIERVHKGHLCLHLGFFRIAKGVLYRSNNY